MQKNGSRVRSSLLFAVLLFFCAGLRSCDPTVTFGFPTIAWELTSSLIWIAHLTNAFINLIFAFFSFVLVFKLTSMTRYKENQHLRWGGIAALSYLAYADLVLPTLLFLAKHTEASHNFLDFLQAIACYPILILFFLTSKLFPLFDNLQRMNQEEYLLLHPSLSNFYPYADDMIYRLHILPSLALLFLLGFGVSKFVSWVRKYFLKRSINLS